MVFLKNIEMCGGPTSHKRRKRIPIEKIKNPLILKISNYPKLTSKQILGRPINSCRFSIKNKKSIF